jgi:hypothetical protein
MGIHTLRFTIPVPALHDIRGYAWNGLLANDASLLEAT